MADTSVVFAKLLNNGYKAKFSITLSRHEVIFYDKYGNINETISFSNPLTDGNEWSHIVLGVGNSTIFVYLNGVEILNK